MTPEHQPISPFQIDVPAGGALSEIVIGAPTDPERCSLAGADLSDNSQVARELRIRARLNLESAKNLSHESVLARFHHAFEHIAQHALGYEAVIGQTKLALATGNHQLLIGGTGTGKSYYAKGVAGTLGADTLLYENQLSLETTEDALYGLIPMRRISDGKGSRNLDGSLVLADVAFLDEVFDARDELLRSMLWPLSDRLYHNGDTTIESNLHAVIACGNYTRLNSKTEAFLDRFLFQSNIYG